MGILDYLGIEVKPQPDGSLIFAQCKCLRDSLAKNNMQEVKPVPSLMLSTCKLSKEGNDYVSKEGTDP